MRLIVDNREIDLANIFPNLTGNVVEIILTLDVNSLSDHELEQVIIDSLLKEIREFKSCR